MNRRMQTVNNFYISAKQTPIGLDVRYFMGRGLVYYVLFCKKYAYILILYILSFDIELHWLPRCVCVCVCVCGV